MKETKESKCVSCAYQKQKTNGNHAWKVKFENNDEGFINTKENVAPFTEGTVCKYVIEKVTLNGNDGKPFSFMGISKFKEPFAKRDDSKERVKAHAIECVTKLVAENKFNYTDALKDKGITLEQHMVTTTELFETMMLEALTKKGKDNVYIIMSSFDMSLVFYIMKDFKRFKDVFNKLMDRI